MPSKWYDRFISGEDGVRKYLLSFLKQAVIVFSGSVLRGEVSDNELTNFCVGSYSRGLSSGGMQNSTCTIRQFFSIGSPHGITGQHLELVPRLAVRVVYRNSRRNA